MELKQESWQMDPEDPGKIANEVIGLTNRLVRQLQQTQDVTFPMTIAFEATYGNRIRATLVTREELW